MASIRAEHPGRYVRDEVLKPKKLSVLAAAKLVGVGRPALSNFLHGHASATTEMALRIEVAFGVPAKKLLDMQAAYDAAQSSARGAPSNVIPYVVPLLQIRAADVEKWIDEKRVSARTRFPVLVRTLVNSTVGLLDEVDFPGNEDGESHGWDGQVRAPTGTRWVPSGRSVWELGTSSDAKRKASDDFLKRTASTSAEDQRETTFVFITPRRWPAKREWAKELSESANWKEVRAYDATDLEQWLEQSIPGQVWFANETGRPSEGVRALDKCWSDWASVASPALSGELFEPAIRTKEGKIADYLNGEPGRPFVIAADSTDEALAFLAQCFSRSRTLAVRREKVLVFDRPGVLGRFAGGTKAFVAVTGNREVEREFGSIAREVHTFVLYPRNVASIDPTITLEPLDYESFKKGLESMNFGRDDIRRLDAECGRSLTVLRRRLATVPAIRRPTWATDHDSALSLVPFMLAGAWIAENKADREILKSLAQADSYEELEKRCQRFVTIGDPPLWSLGNYRGVVSKIDLMFAIAEAITRADLERFFEIVGRVLSEDDPALDLPEKDRWAAAIHGKTREFSNALRNGVCESLVLLAVHGKQLLKARLGFDCESATNQLVRNLLTPLTSRVLEAHDRDLPEYAEAAPSEFLKIIEEDLQTRCPATLDLMRPADPGLFGGGCPRTGLLWALENLAWNPATLPHACLILARLAEVPITDNWSNKPINSLLSVFRSWMPQTSASHAERMDTIKLIAKRHPQVAWKICVEQINLGGQVGDYAHRPKWRNDAYGHGEPFPTTGPIHAFVRDIVNMVLAWSGGYTADQLSDLVQRLTALSEPHQMRVWELVTNWTKTASDSEKSKLREQVRRVVTFRPGKRQSPRLALSMTQVARQAYEALEPTDVIERNAWLFQSGWLEESADELYEENPNYEDRERRIQARRLEALKVIVAERGEAGLLGLAQRSGASYQAGWLVGEGLAELCEVDSLVASASGLRDSAGVMDQFIRGLLMGTPEISRRPEVLERVKSRVTPDDFVRILRLAPFRPSTWEIVDHLDAKYQPLYWTEVYPEMAYGSDAEAVEAINRLLAANRPRAALAAARFRLEAAGAELLYRVLSDILKEGNDKPGEYLLEHYYVQKAFVVIDRSPLFSLEQKALLEFAFIDVLAQRGGPEKEHGISNLEKYVQRNPQVFVQAVVWTYKRKDDGKDPEELQVPAERVSVMALRGYRLLDSLRELPGRDGRGVLSTEALTAWVEAVRSACAELGRLEVADLSIGQLLSHAPADTEGIWPCNEVRDVLEYVHSKRMAAGVCTGLFNSRGAVWRGRGGDQERGLANRYRSWAKALRYSHPFVASAVMDEMVNSYERDAEREDLQEGINNRLTSG